MLKSISNSLWSIYLKKNKKNKRKGSGTDRLLIATWSRGVLVHMLSSVIRDYIYIVPCLDTYTYM